MRFPLEKIMHPSFMRMMLHIIRLTGFLLVWAIWLPANIRAQNFWQQTSGPAGADVRALAITNNGSILAGTIGKGAFLSSDNGATWTPASTGLVGRDDSTILALAVKSSGLVLAGTLGGVFRSNDGGSNWVRVNNGLTATNVRALAINANGDILAGTVGGVFRSANNGDAWTPLRNGLADTISVEELAISDSGHVFAGTFGYGVFRSTDNGNTWRASNAGLGNIFVFALMFNHRGDLFAGTNAGVFRSQDGGNTWAPTGLTLGLVRAFAINARGDIFAGLEGDGVFRSQDNGASWSSIVNTGLTNNVVNALTLDTQGFLFAGTKGSGVFRSVNTTTTVLTRAFSDTTTTVDGPLLAFNLDDYFDNGSSYLLYSASSADSSKLFVQVQASQSILRVTPLAVGSAEVVVEAFDFTNGLSASDTFKVTVTSAVQPPALVKVYWTDFFNSSIQRANSDGTQRETLVAALPNNPINLAIDSGAGKMYWCENFASTTPKLQRANLDGGNREVIIDFSGLFIVPSIALDIPNQKIYWAANPTASGMPKAARRAPGTIARANFDGSNIETVNSTAEFPVGLAVGGGKVYWYDDATGWIERANLDGSAFEQIIEQPSQQSAPLALDPVAGKIYWIADGYLRRANLDGSNHEDLLYSAGAAYALTLDTANRKVYWFSGASGNGNGAIRRANYDGSHVETLPILNLTAVFGLAVGHTIKNRPPVVANKIPDVTLAQADSVFRLIVDLKNVFNDPDGDVLSYSAASANNAIARPEVTGNLLTVKPGAMTGKTSITVSARDPKGETTATVFNVTTVKEITPPVLAPGGLPDIALGVGGKYEIDLYAYFSDADSLDFTASSSDGNIALAGIANGSKLSVTAGATIGAATIIVTADDNKAGVTADTFKVTVYISPPPEIKLLTITPAIPSRSDTLVIAAEITDEQGAGAIQAVTAGVRRSGETRFDTLQVKQEIINNKLRATVAVLPAQMGVTGMEYFFAATDNFGVPARLPATGGLSVRVRLAEGVSKNWEFSGPEQTSYRLISIPLDLDQKNPAGVLEDDLGQYDSKQWRFYDWETDANGDLRKMEFPNTAAMALGKAFWLIVRRSGKVVTSGPGITANTANRFAIALQRGWNLIGNPFNFLARPEPVSRNGNNLAIYSYAGQWNGPLDLQDQANWLDRFGGFAVFSEAADSMFITPVRLTSNLSKAESPAAPQPSWSIRILAQCQYARDDNNLIAAADGASREWDLNDHPEPPGVGEYVSVYFPHPEWGKLSKTYSTDFRPEPSAGDEWDFAVETNIRDEVKLSFAGIENVPGEYEVWLVDKALQLAQNLRQTTHYSVAGRGPKNPKRLTLVVSKHGKMEEKYAAFQTAPATYMLGQNFPNPFNPATTIRYALPQAGTVTLQVYNLLGELVATLVNNELKKAGYHVAIWNGRNASGSAVANGVYFYRLRAGSFVQTRKMVLVE